MRCWKETNWRWNVGEMEFGGSEELPAPACGLTPAIGTESAGLRQRKLGHQSVNLISANYIVH